MNRGLPAASRVMKAQRAGGLAHDCACSGRVALFDGLQHLGAVAIGFFRGQVLVGPGRRSGKRPGERPPAGRGNSATLALS